MKEGTVTFLPVKYMSASNGTPYDPNVTSLWDNPDYKTYFSEMYEKNWHLVNVQPLLQGMFEAKTSGPLGIFAKAAWAYGYGYSITAGYYFFGERDIEESNPGEE